MNGDTRDGRGYAAQLDDDLFERVAAVIDGVDVIETLSIKHPNWISSFDRTGVWVETERSRARGNRSATGSRVDVHHRLGSIE